MIPFPVPGSWGSPLMEANGCHTPAGSSAGGQFCSKGAGVVAVEGKRYYVRFGDLPLGGRSRNHATGSIESGVSAYEAVGRGGRFVVEVPPDGEWAHDDLMDRLRQAMSGVEPVYILDGERIGIGGDGEPLLQRPRIVGKIPADRLRHSGAP